MGSSQQRKLDADGSMQSNGNRRAHRDKENSLWAHVEKPKGAPDNIGGEQDYPKFGEIAEGDKPPATKDGLGSLSDLIGAADFISSTESRASIQALRKENDM